MFKRLKALYQQYKPYIRVDLIMYGVLILLIVLPWVIPSFDPFGRVVVPLVAWVAE